MRPIRAAVDELAAFVGATKIRWPWSPSGTVPRRSLSAAERCDEEPSLDLPGGRRRDGLDEEEGLVRFEVRQPRAAPRAQLAFTDASLSKLIVMILVLAIQQDRERRSLQRPGELARPL